MSSTAPSRWIWTTTWSPTGRRSSRKGRRMAEFSGQVAFITGAAHGQGRAVALALAQEGARIAAYDIARPLSYPGYALGEQADLESLAAAVQERASACVTFAGDVRD